MALPLIRTERLVITLLTPQYAPLLMQYRIANQQHLAQWEPLREAQYFTQAAAQQSAQTALDLYFAGTAMQLIALNDKGNCIVGECHFSHIVRGPLQACYLGYSIAEHCQGQGLATEMLTAAVEFAFTHLKLNRVMANYLPHNYRSARLLLQLGFEQEGLAKRYLNIAGQWQDHVLSAKLAPLAQA